jgi:competence protein ComGC
MEMIKKEGIINRIYLTRNKFEMTAIILILIILLYFSIVFLITITKEAERIREYEKNSIKNFVYNKSP